MDMISKYRQREKISNTINHFNEAKRKWKEEEIEKMSLKVHSLAHHAHHHVKKGSGHHQTHHTQLKNTPHQNWLLWHYAKGKKPSTLRPVEIRMNKIKMDADQLEEQQKQDRTWFENYKKIVGVRISTTDVNSSRSSILRERSKSVS